MQYINIAHASEHERCSSDKLQVWTFFKIKNESPTGAVHYVKQYKGKKEVCTTLH